MHFTRWSFLFFILATISGLGSVTVKTRGGGTAHPCITILQPITFSITSNGGTGGVSAIVFQSAWNSATTYVNIATAGGNPSPTLTNLTTSNSTTLSYNWISGNVGINDVHLLDSYIIFQSGNYALSTTAGNQVRLSAGTYFGQVNASFPVFPSGTYEVFLVDGNGTRVSSNGVTDTSVPAISEPPVLASTYSDWMKEVFTTADQADFSISGENGNPSGDGIDNLRKYAFGLDPYKSVSSGLPQPSTVPRSGHTYLALTYQAPSYQPPADLLYTLQSSTNLVNWTQPAGGFTLSNTQGPTNGLKSYTYTLDGLPIDQTAKGFMQVKIQEVPLFDPPSGYRTSGSYISLSGPPQTTLYYTLDGSTPTNSSMVYTTAIYVNLPQPSSSKTIKVQAYRNGVPYGVMGQATYLGVDEGPGGG